MITKEHFVGAIEHEVKVIKHLLDKIPDDKLDYKPTEKQRNLLELLQYLSIMVPAMFKMILTNDYGVFGDYVKKSETTTVKNFKERIEESLAEAKSIFGEFSEEELDKEVEMFGTKQTKRLFLFNVLNMLAAYKMQLFLYIKAAGNQEIGTSNVWRGMDMEVK